MVAAPYRSPNPSVRTRLESLVSAASFGKKKGVAARFLRGRLFDRVESELQDLLSLVVVIPEEALESGVEDVDASYGG